MLRIPLLALSPLALLTAPVLGQDVMETPVGAIVEVDPEPELELPERTTKPAPAGHPILFQFGDILARMHDRAGPGRPEEILTRMATQAEFVTELGIADDAHTQTITGTATCQPILNGRGVRISLDGQAAVGSVTFPYASESMLSYDVDAEEYVQYQRDSLSAQIFEMRGTMNDAETELTLQAAGQAGDIVQVIAFSEYGISEIRNYIRPIGTDAYAFRGLTTLKPIETADEPERFLVLYTPAWGEPDDAGVYPVMPETHRAVYGRHLAHLRTLANNGLLERSGHMDRAEHIVIMRAPDAETAKKAAEQNPAVMRGLFRVSVRPYEPLYTDPSEG